MAADTVSEWSNLPPELLALIAEFLPSCTDLLRFRSVCASWRSSIAHFNTNLSPSPLTLPTLNFPKSSSEESVHGTVTVHEHTIYRLQLSRNNPNSSITCSSKPWLVMVRHLKSGQKRLLNPLTECSLVKPATSPRVLNLLDFSLLELGKNYIPGCYTFHFNRGAKPHNILDIHKIVLFPLNYSWNASHNYAVMALFGEGRLGILKPGNENWINVDEQRSGYKDIINYKGKFYAIDGTGRAIVIDLSLLNVAEIASTIGDVGGKQKSLVESSGDLLLVDSYLHEGKRTVIKFRVYKLNEKEHRWVELMSLGDRMLFVGDVHEWAFSASAGDFEGCKGNCIYFTEKYLFSASMGLYFRDVSVFKFEDGSLGPVDTSPEYFEILRPPGMWLTQHMSSSGC